jgi:hypothetical protein
MREEVEHVFANGARAEENGTLYRTALHEICQEGGRLRVIADRPVDYA